eukprot:15475963-Alexandrium_andersonii.AAC.1
MFRRPSSLATSAGTVWSQIYFTGNTINERMHISTVWAYNRGVLDDANTEQRSKRVPNRIVRIDSVGHQRRLNMRTLLQ